jgi:hypothetical protein
MKKQCEVDTSSLRREKTQLQAELEKERLRARSRKPIRIDRNPQNNDKRDQQHGPAPQVSETPTQWRECTYTVRWYAAVEDFVLVLLHAHYKKCAYYKWSWCSSVFPVPKKKTKSRNIAKAYNYTENYHLILLFIAECKRQKQCETNAHLHYTDTCLVSYWPQFQYFARSPMKVQKRTEPCTVTRPISGQWATIMDGQGFNH